MTLTYYLLPGHQYMITVHIHLLLDDHSRLVSSVVVRCTVRVTVDGGHEVESATEGHEEGERAGEDEDGKRDRQS